MGDEGTTLYQRPRTTPKDFWNGKKKKLNVFFDLSNTVHIRLKENHQLSFLPFSRVKEKNKTNEKGVTEVLKLDHKVV